MNLTELVKNYISSGYKINDAEAKVCQDIILIKISKSPFYNNVTIKGGVVMHNISNDKRRATKDLDIDFIRYSLSDESIKEFISKLKKANSVLHQGLSAIARENGYPLDDYTFLINEKNFIDEFEKVTNVIRTCNSTRDCYGEDEFLKYTFLNGVAADNAFIDGKTAITSDGIAYVYALEPFANFGISQEDYANQIASIVVDINTAERKPNKAGMDVFVFYLINGKGIVPAGSKSFDECNRQNLGGTCTAKVLKEGKIDY